MPVVPAKIAVGFKQSPKVVETFARKRIVPVALSSAQWDAVDTDIKRNAFFSAQVSNEKLLTDMREFISRAEAGTPGFSRGSFISEFRQKLGATPAGKEKLTNLSSYRRLGLIYDFHRRRNNAHAQYEATSGKDFRADYPARELYRAAAANEPRDWTAIWQAAGGRLYSGRMIARWDDPIWTTISRFGEPFPPFDYGSHMDVRDVSVEDAEALGVELKTPGAATPSTPEPAPEAAREPLPEEFSPTKTTAEPAPVRDAPRAEFSAEDTAGALAALKKLMDWIRKGKGGVR